MSAPFKHQTQWFQQLSALFFYLNLESYDGFGCFFSYSILNSQEQLWWLQMFFLLFYFKLSSADMMGPSIFFSYSTLNSKVHRS